MQEQLISAFNDAIQKPPVDLDNLCLSINVSLTRKVLDAHISGLLELNDDGTY